VAIIGAGVAGSVCARGLAEAVDRVVVFDKGRSVGGRLAQRRRDGAIFDHGAQFVRPRDPLLMRLLEAGVAAGVVARWPAAERDDRPVYVGRPAMATPLKLLLGEVPVQTGCRIDRLERDARGWLLHAGEGDRHGPFEEVVLAIPAPQAAALLATIGDAVPPALAAAAASAVMAPCWAMLVAFDPLLDVVGHDAVALDGGPVSWIARNTSKPGREGLDAWTLHASPEWSAANLEAAPDVVAALLLEAFHAATGTASRSTAYLAVHRWRYALVTSPVGRPALFDPESGLGLCGDWCLGGKIEAAFLSGRALVKLMRD
jgi:predicted NAD/FAD-dependent oxidoreductase